MTRLEVSGDPSEPEVAAIVAAIEVAWPRAGAPEQVQTSQRWRWSGRWWAKPIPQRRIRPW